MNTGGEAAEQIVRMSLEGFEVAAKITGAGAKNIAILLYSILKEEKENQRKSKADKYAPFWQGAESLYRQKRRLKEVHAGSKKYGVLYCVLTDRKTKTQMQRSMSSPVPRTHRKSAVLWNALILLRWIPLLL